MKLPFTLVLFLIGSLLISSCNKGPTGGIPFYLKMDSAVVMPFRIIGANTSTQGIKDVQVEAGASNLGTYELPCNFPILLKDSVFFVVTPVVWPDGQSGTPTVYPMLNPDVFTLAATSGNVYTHKPVFTYKEADSVMFNEDFEITSEYNSNMVRTTDSAKYGHSCGKITVGPYDSSVIACQQAYYGRSAPYPLTAGNEIWVELDYKSDVPLWSGIIEHFSSGATDTVQLLFLLPQTNWTKEYVKISQVVGQSGASTYNLFFQALNPSGFAGGSAYLDNIRLIHLVN